LPHLCSNRSNAFLQLSDFKNALEDAQKATSLRPEWDKGWYRTGSVLEAQGKLAKVCFTALMKCSSTSSTLCAGSIQH
jgi:predicted TPR repeat methyltransferase